LETVSHIEITAPFGDGNGTLTQYTWHEIKTNRVLNKTYQINKKSQYLTKEMFHIYMNFFFINFYALHFRLEGD
jgi:hypothetical protein